MMLRSAAVARSLAVPARAAAATVPAARGLATKKKSKAEAVTVKLPVQLFGLSARYANALFVSAVKSSTLPAVETDLKQIKEWTATSESFKQYLANPVVSRQDKVKDMEKVSVGMNDTTRGLLAVLAENGRLVELSKVIDTFDILLSAQRGIVKATVTTSESLAAKQLGGIEKAISAGYLEKGQTLELAVKVEPAILGGLQVQIGDRFLDLSVQSEINNVAKVLA